MKLIHFKLRQPSPPTPVTLQNSARMLATSHLLRIADEGPAENTTQRRPYLDERRQDGHLFHRNGSSDRGRGGLCVCGGVTRPRRRETAASHWSFGGVRSQDN